LEAGKELRRFSGHRGPIYAVAFSADGRRGLSGGADGWAILWELDSGREVARSFGNGRLIGDAALSPDGRSALVVGFGRFQLWDWQTGLESYPTSQSYPHARAIFLPNGKHALTADGDALVRLWDLSGDFAHAVRAGRSQQGEGTLSTLLERQPQDLTLLLTRGRLHARKGQWQEAAADFTRAVQTADGSKRLEAWLDRGRCRAMLGRWAEAATDYARALELSAEPERTRLVSELARWEQVLTGVAQARPDDPAVGQTLLDRARARLETLAGGQPPRPDDVQTRLLAALFHRRKAELLRRQPGDGTAAEAAGHEKQAWALFDKLPANPAYAGELADFLFATFAGDWEVLQPVEMKSAGGATLTRLADGSILAGGKNPDRDVYTLTTRTRLKDVTALRLDVLPDPSLPENGPGRAPDGTFVLTEITAENGGKALRWSGATASYSQEGFPATLAIDGDPGSGWAIRPQVGRANHAVFTFLARPDTDAEEGLTIRLHFQWNPFPQRSLGRFRLSVTRRPLLVYGEALSRHGVPGWTRLAATYALRKEWTRALAALEKSTAAAHRDTPHEHLLLALVQAELDRPAEARRSLDRAFARLSDFRADGALMPLAEEVLSRVLAKSPEDMGVLAQRVRLHRMLGATEQAAADSQRLLALLDRRPGAAPAGAGPRLRAELYAHRGDWDRAAADLRAYFAATKDSGPRWYQTDWWVVGPYPEDLKASCAPEADPDPFRPVAAAGGKGGKVQATLRWQPAGPSSQEVLDLGALFRHAQHISAYALQRVYSSQRRQVAVLLGSDDAVRLWHNGKLVHENPTYRPALPDEDAAPITLEPGWNTLLAKVPNGISNHALALRLSGEPSDLVRAWLETGRWAEAEEPAIDQALARRPNDPQAVLLGALFYRGKAEELRRRGGQPPAAVAQAEKQAVDLYQKLRKFSPTFSALSLAADVQSERSFAAVTFLLTRELERGPGDVPGWLVSGDLSAQWGQFDRAAAGYARAFALEESGDPYVWFEHAYLLLQTADEEGYRKLCRRMRERFGESKDVEEIALLAHTCVLASGALNDPERVLELAEQRLAMTGPPSRHYEWSLHVLGLAQYRAGNWERAAEVLGKAVQDHPDLGVNLLDYLILSMAQQRLGHPAEARQWLDKAEQWIREQQPRRGRPFAPPGWIWRDWLGVQMLHREAQVLLHGKTG
jgi:tetratricopeptide (TPR) repeat protein